MRQDYKAKLVLTEQQYNQKIVSLIEGCILGVHLYGKSGNIREFNREKSGN